MISYRKYKEDASLNTAQSIAARRAFAPSAFRALAYGTGTLPTMIPFIHHTFPFPYRYYWA